MTHAEKMLSLYLPILESYVGPDERIKLWGLSLIEQVAERTRLECAKAIEREKWSDRTSIPKNSVINARWEDEEV